MNEILKDMFDGLEIPPNCYPEGQDLSPKAKNPYLDVGKGRVLLVVGNILRKARPNQIKEGIDFSEMVLIDQITIILKEPRRSEIENPVRSEGYLKVLLFQGRKP